MSYLRSNFQPLMLMVQPLMLIALVLMVGLLMLVFRAPSFVMIESTLTSGQSVQAPVSVEAIDSKLGVHKGSGAPRKPAPAALAAAGGAGCSLVFTMTPNAQSVAPGGSIAYALSIKNTGLTACQSASYSVYYADNETFVSAAPRPSASNYYWKIGTLQPGAEYAATISTKHNTAVSGIRVANEACATADNAQADACVSTQLSVDAASSAPTPAPAPVVAPTAGSSYMPPQGKEFGVWVWSSPVQLNDAKADQILASLKNNGMNAAYITIDDYLNIASLPDGPAKTAQTASYFTALNRIVASAASRGIAVDVEGGAADWSIPANYWKAFALIDFVKKYNQQYPSAKIRGLQYDVESYLLPSYEGNKASVLSSYIAFIDAAVSQMQGMDAAFSVVIPHFYDSTQKWTPPFLYDGKRVFAFTHLLNILQKKPGSTIIIMSYRNYFRGADGVQGLSVPELTESSLSKYSTKVIIAQETGNVDPWYVTFYGMSKTDFLAAANTIYAGFAGYSSFNGVSVNYLDPFLELY